MRLNTFFFQSGRRFPTGRPDSPFSGTKYHQPGIWPKPGLLPSASAKDNGRSAPIAVDIIRIGGSELLRNELPVNLSRIDGEYIKQKSLPVNVKEADGRAIRNYPLPVVQGK